MVGLLLCLIPPIAAQKVRIDSTPKFDFTNYKRYAWRTHPVFEKKPELLTTYEVGIELVKSAVNKNLIGRGFQPTQQTPDFFITFMLSGEQRQDVDVIYVDGMYGWGGWYGFDPFYYPSWTETVVTNYVQGTLVLDFVDAKTNKLVWRAYCWDEIKDWKNRHENVDNAIKKALKKFPPKK